MDIEGVVRIGRREFPDIEAVQQHTELLDEFNWYRYGEGMVVLGTEFQPTE